MIKAVIIGFSHMHVNEMAKYLFEHPDFDLCAASPVQSASKDIAPFRYTALWNLENVRNNYCSNIYDDYRQMIETEKPDIAFILTENVQKCAVALECIKRGINLCIEKPVAMNAHEARTIKKAADDHGVEVVVNWPVVWREYLHKIKHFADSNIVGTPIKLHYLNGHTGPLGIGAKHRGVTETAEEMTDTDRAQTWWYNKNRGGGAYLDICCYGAMFTRWILGKGALAAESTGMNLATPYADTEDNTASVIRYDTKLSVIEGTWTMPRKLVPSGPTVLCTKGALKCTDFAECNPDVIGYDVYGNSVDLSGFKLGKEFTNMAYHYAEHIKTGKPVYEMLTLDANIEVMEILDACIKSNETKKEEYI